MDDATLAALEKLSASGRVLRSNGQRTPKGSDPRQSREKIRKLILEKYTL